MSSGREGYDDRVKEDRRGRRRRELGLKIEAPKRESSEDSWAEASLDDIDDERGGGGLKQRVKIREGMRPVCRMMRVAGRGRAQGSRWRGGGLAILSGRLELLVEVVADNVLPGAHGAYTGTMMGCSTTARGCTPNTLSHHPQTKPRPPVTFPAHIKLTAACIFSKATIKDRFTNTYLVVLHQICQRILRACFRVRLGQGHHKPVSTLLPLHFFLLLRRRDGG